MLNILFKPSQTPFSFPGFMEVDFFTSKWSLGQWQDQGFWQRVQQAQHGHTQQKCPSLIQTLPRSEAVAGGGGAPSRGPRACRGGAARWRARKCCARDPAPPGCAPALQTCTTPRSWPATTPETSGTACAPAQHPILLGICLFLLAQNHDQNFLCIRPQQQNRRSSFTVWPGSSSAVRNGPITHMQSLILSVCYEIYSFYDTMN